MTTYRRYRALSTLFLCTTIISSAGLPDALYAAGPQTRKASQNGAADGGRSGAELRRELAGAWLQGERALIAQAYEATYNNPKLRDAVVRQVTDLAPSALRHAMTAADLGVLTSGQPMALAPNAAQVLATRNAGASGLTASSYQNVAMAVNNSPNLPKNPPTAYDQAWNQAMIGAQTAYNRGFTGAGVNVTVADTGFDVGNAALSGQLLTSFGRNYLISAEGEAYDVNDLSNFGVTDGHGTHVAGIVAAKKFDNVYAHGIAYDSRVIPLRVIIPDAPVTNAPGVTDAANTGLAYFAGLTNSMVYNASYGPGPGDKDPAFKVWPIAPDSNMEAAVAMRALQAGKIIVAANGNGRDHSPIAGLNPTGLALLPFLNPEHSTLGVYNDAGKAFDFTALQRQPGQLIAVMAVGDDKAAAYYSQLCGVTASWCVAAPGGDQKNNIGVYAPVPDNTYAAYQGTSMAAPTVSGAIAVLIQANPTYNAQDLSRLLFSTTEDLGAPGIDAVFGYGLIRLDRATDSPIAGIAANANIAVAAATTTYWSRLLNTQGDFTKSGDGVLTIAGRTNAGGNVFAALGTLAVDGTLSMNAGSRLNVAQPATLAGFGVINGDTTIAGTLSPGKVANYPDLVFNTAYPPAPLPGNSVGSLTFNGSVTLTSTANTRIDIDGSLIVPGGPGTYDKIYVTGAGNTFWAGGTLTPVLRGSVGTVSNYTPALGTEIPFVQALNGARTAGAFATLVQPTAGLPANGRFDLVYEAATIRLRVTPASFAQIAASDIVTPGAASAPAGPSSSTERSVAAILDKERAPSGEMPTAAEKALFDALYNLDTEAKLDKALSQLGGPGQPAISSAPLQAFSGFLGAVGDRQETLAVGGQQGQDGAAQSFALSYAGRNVMSAETGSAMNALASFGPAQQPQDGWSAWGQGFGRTSRVGDSGELSGSKAVSGGFTVGADRWFANNLIAGGAFGYARTSATSTDIRGTSDTYAGAAYASWSPGAAVVDFRIAAGPSQITTSRQMILTSTALQGSTNGIGLGTSLEAGYRFALAPNVVLKPFAGLGWQGFRRDGYSETQLPFGLVYAAQTYDRLTTTLGASLGARLRTTDGATLMPELKLGWGHDLRDTTLVSTAALLDESFLIDAARPGRDAALVGAKISGWRTENFRLFAAYNGEFRSNAESHQVSGGARLSW